MILRRAGPADWQTIWPLWREVVKAGDTYCLDPASTSQQARNGWLAPDSEVAHPREQTWVAGDTGVVGGDSAAAEAELLGTYHLLPNQDGPGAHVANGSYMVASAARGRGIGRTFVEHSLVQAAAAGYTAIQFNAVAASNVNALGLYASLGFDVVGRVPQAFRHPHQGLVDLLVLHRTLEASMPNGLEGSTPGGSEPRAGWAGNEPRAGWAGNEP